MKIYFKSGNEYVGKEFTFNEFGNEKFQIVGDFQNSGEVRHSYSAMNTLADNYEKDILVVNARPSENLEIVKLVDMQKFLYEQKKAKRENEKKQKAKIQKVKEIRFHLNIAENDIKTKVRKIKDFVNENCKVKITLELRGRESEMMEFARTIWSNFISNFDANEFVFSPVKEVNNTITAFISK